MTAPSFHRLRVSEKRLETADSISLSFMVPAALRDQYRFSQGQFVTLRSDIEGRSERRSYSICVSVGDYDERGQLRVGIKRVAGGLFSNWIADSLHAGDEIDVMTPDGRFFTALLSSNRKRYLAFAGGSGITPILSLIKTTLSVEPGSSFTLVYGNRGAGSIMFLEELEDLKNRHLGRLRLYHVLSDEPHEIALFNGLLDQQRCSAFLSELVPAGSIDEAFVCGPEPMMNAAEAALLAAGVPKTSIHIERFGVPMPASKPLAERSAALAPGSSAGARVAQVELIVEGKSRRLQVGWEGTAILDAGLTAGIDLPFACKGGVCCTCRAKVLEGSVRMDKNYTLEEWEIKQGFVLTCQSHPTSDRVVISYDER
jgi:ring-1,2-phenylacetyl-CoA epoxidase subunit PaaE